MTDRAIPGVERLSERELQILQFRALGYSARRTAEVCGISYQTVRTHSQNILRRAGAHSMGQAIAQAKDAGVL